MNLTSIQSVVQVTWPWRDPIAVSLTTGRSGGHKRRAVIQAVIMAAVATLMTMVWHKIWLGLAIYSLSAVVIISGFLIPTLFRALERVGQWLGRMVGIGITWLMLMPFFYLCFAPARLILKLMGKDPMHRRFERNRSSYWVDHKPPSTPQPYTRQY
ncbi:MAG: hypothetical protein L6437_13405 [Kiritimatiellae bacterium]|nr:hypothetical protein [Verrucomicrobiota bacterium]MBU4366306.1 hypothetical protein [Verrucomicrobiota bacterium]MCG2661228.1 hypothetical protein [Kiritimatiellia bacterium]